MYRNKKKMIIVGATSVGVLAVFGVSAWAIINQSYKTPLDSVSGARVSGATVFLGDNGQFQYGKMSFNDWLIYNYAHKIDVARSGSTTTYTFYSRAASPTTGGTGGTGGGTTQAAEYVFATLAYDSSNNSYLLKTGSNQDFELVNSTITGTSSDSSFGVANNYSSWSSTTSLNQSFTFNQGSDSSTHIYSGANYSISYSKATSTGGGSGTSTNTTTYTTRVTSTATNSTLWERTMVIPGAGDTSTATRTTYTSATLGGSLTITYTPTATDGNITSYTVAYTSNTTSGGTGGGTGGSTVASQSQLFTFLGITSTSNTKADFSQSRLSSEDYFLYLPDMTL
ncbi:hypothetical protein D8X55_00435 [Malacoplasma penetrans]|uniref:Uncharacterized protein n=1 Tax=Malacoplasma penetrans (strain HF-2) TaxID=272633 RepID=Q8EX17_MALP2|nr:hypothetical protein [Malacoplasma penetrans]RXY97384.1 hypothetical protein D8X55_00435 [Malacoplasma penetrans]BAC43823.1 hypothetical protein [Malacoplasma penetrans HF-2]